MAQKPVREFFVKQLFAKEWDHYFTRLNYPFKSVLISPETSVEHVLAAHTWLKKDDLVVKPDMLFGKRGINNLVLYKNKKPGDVDWDFAKKWMKEKSKSETELKSGQKGYLTHYIVEPFVPHASDEEYYIAATAQGLQDVLYLSAAGGIDIESGWDEKVTTVVIELDDDEKKIKEKISKGLPKDIPTAKKNIFVDFAIHFYFFFRDMHFAYLELNPFVIKDKNIFLLDAVARVDDTAEFVMKEKWENIEYPASFGMSKKCPEVEAIEKVDHHSGSSLKLSILNRKGRIWTLVAGGGASVVYADTIADLAGVTELANYGEYSGGPTTEETRFYAATVFDLMTREKNQDGKILLIGGAIANFTDVAKTFEGIVLAMQEYKEALKKNKVKIYVRRGGPNYQEGLKNIEMAAKEMGLYIEVYGPETHVTEIVKKAINV